MGGLPFITLWKIPFELHLKPFLAVAVSEYSVFEYIATTLILRTGMGRKGSISLSKLTRKAVKPLMM